VLIGGSRYDQDVIDVDSDGREISEEVRKECLKVRTHVLQSADSTQEHVQLAVKGECSHRLTCFGEGA
jgi:hypothetical protein